MNPSKERDALAPIGGWTKPRVKRFSAGMAEGASNGGQDFGTGQS